MTQMSSRVWFHDFGSAFGNSTRPLAWFDIIRMLSAMTLRKRPTHTPPLQNVKASQVKSSQVKSSLASGKSIENGNIF